ncbi:hypothetical protein [Devosia sp. 2618]|uniref:hypothetical protein n=1 Tax=Devosia sp. 2618 TaxID=3156454 RepID=UPI003393E30E
MLLVSAASKMAVYAMVPDVVAALITDAMSAYGLAGSSASTAVGLSAWQKLTANRTEQARQILIEELRLGQKLIGDVPDAELASVTFRYARAAVEGTARLNLRLLAAVAAGQMREKALYADEFLRHADMLASLSKEEVLLLGEFSRAEAVPRPTEATKHQIWQTVKDEMQHLHNHSEDETRALAVSCTRSGLISLENGPWVEPMFPVSTKSLRALNALADIEGVLHRHRRQQSEDSGKHA